MGKSSGRKQRLDRWRDYVHRTFMVAGDGRIVFRPRRPEDYPRHTDPAPSVRWWNTTKAGTAPAWRYSGKRGGHYYRTRHNGRIVIITMADICAIMGISVDAPRACA